MSWLLDLVSWCVKEGREDVENWVQYSTGPGRGLSTDQLALHVVSQQAKLAARAPVTPAAVGSLPGVRSAISQKLITADIGFLIYRMCKSVLYQAAVYGRQLDAPDLPERILMVLGVAFGDPRTREALVGRVPGKAFAKVARNAAEYGDRLGEAVVKRFHNRGEMTAMPLVGRPFFGAQNFIFISAAAMAGRFIFNDGELSREELHDLDARVLELGRAVLALMLWVARGDGQFDGTEQETIMMLEESLVMPGASYEDLEANLPETPDWERIRKQFRTEDEKAGLIENILMVVWADGEKQPQEDRMCRRLAAELVADRMIDDIEAAVRSAFARQ